MKTLFNYLFIAGFSILVSCESPAQIDPVDPDTPVVPIDPNQPSKSVWSKRANCGMSMNGVRGYQIGDEIYYLSSDLLWAYNYKTDKWTQKAAIPQSMLVSYGGEFVLNNKFYVVDVHSSKIREYDPKTNLWSESTLSTKYDGDGGENLRGSIAPYFTLNGVVYGITYKYNEQENIWKRYVSPTTLKSLFVSVGNNGYQIFQDFQDKSRPWYLLEFNPAIKEAWVTKLRLDVSHPDLKLDDSAGYMYFVDKKNIRLNLIYVDSQGRYTELSYLINLSSNSCTLDRSSSLVSEKFVHNVLSSVTTTDGRVFIGPYNASYYEYVP